MFFFLLDCSIIETMKRFVLLLLPFLFLSFCSPDFYKYNLDLGIRSAKYRLWKEALYRFKRAAKYRETAEVYNNMAVAYEALGDFENAKKCYEKALSLAPTNREIRSNYAIFLELTKKHREKGKKQKGEKK